MKRELKHDILAEKIWDRLPEQDKQLRQVRRSIAQRAADYFAGQGSLAGEPELVNWQGLSAKLKLEEQEKQFIERSWQEVRAQKAEEERRLAELEEQARREKELREGAEEAQRTAEENAKVAAANAQQAKRRTRLALAAFLAALLFVAGTFVLWRQSQNLAGDLEVQKKKLANNVEELQDKETALQRALTNAKNAKDTAEARQIEAERSENKAKQQTQIAEEAKARLETNTREAMPVLIRDIDNLILYLKYDSALANCKTAWNLDPGNRKVSWRIQEVAYFFTESGAYDKAKEALAYIGRKPARAGSSPEQRRKELLSIIESMDGQYLKDSLETRYYPDMVKIEGDTFTPGCDVRWEGIDDCSDAPRMVVSDFYIARTETTVWQYFLYIAATTKDTGREMPDPPSWQWKGKDPMVYVSWYDAIAYANWLSRQRDKQPVYRLETPPDPNDLYDQEKQDSTFWQAKVDWDTSGFRLPTEAEWEYAARGGKDSEGFLYAGRDSLNLVGWYYGNNDPSGAKPVKGKQPNELGLYDMSGNVWEWCWDWYGSYPDSLIADYRGPKSGHYRVLRGGSCYSNASYARVSYRYNRGPDFWFNRYGFRLARAVTF